MGEILQGFSYAQSEVKECQENLNDRVLIPVAHDLLTEGFVRNTNSKKTNATRSMTETLPYAVDTDALGNASVTAMQHSTHSVRCVNSKAGLFPPRRYTTRHRYPRVELMQGTTSLLCVRLVILKSMPGVEIDGTNKVVASTIVVATSFMGRGIKISTPFHLCNGRGLSRTNSQKFSGE